MNVYVLYVNFDNISVGVFTHLDDAKFGAQQLVDEIAKDTDRQTVRLDWQSDPLLNEHLYVTEPVAMSVDNEFGGDLSIWIKCAEVW